MIGVAMSRPAPSIPMQRLQRADRFLGRLVLTALQPWRWIRRLRPARDASRVRRVLLIKFWGVGSLQLLTPAVRSLRQRHPGARLVLLTLEGNADFAGGLGVFDELRCLDVSGGSWRKIALRVLRLLAGLRADAYDRVYDFEFFTRFSALVSFVAGAPRSHGFSSTSAWRGGLHTDDVTFNRYWHVARNFRALAGGEDGAELSWRDLAPYEVEARERLALGAKLAAAGLAPATPYLVLNPNAGQLSLERRWPRERFTALAERALATWDGAVVLIGSAHERAYTAGVGTEARDGGRLLDLCGELTMGELCALLEGARAVVSNDSGPMHLAAALGAPTLGLFGPETPLMYEPLGEHARSLWRPTVCSPCINVHQGKVATCIHERPECLENIGVDEAWNWLAAQLASRPRRLRLAAGSVEAVDA